MAKHSILFLLCYFYNVSWNILLHMYWLCIRNKAKRVLMVIYADSGTCELRGELATECTSCAFKSSVMHQNSTDNFFLSKQMEWWKKASPAECLCYHTIFKYSGTWQKKVYSFNLICNLPSFLSNGDPKQLTSTQPLESMTDPRSPRKPS